ncbi:thiamine ABC transporter substrate-binding protein [Arcanobacterium haemolyticum]|nr:thiamine ABC transporter substrate-binding protein [Arcanobacterium haemolyticum]
MNHAKVGSLALAGVLALAMSACSSSGQKAESTAGTQGSVNVLVHDSFDLPKELIERFEEETGYKLTTTSAGDAGVTNYLLLAKDKAGIDAAYGIDSYTAYQALDGGIFATYVSQALPESARGDVLEDSLNPIDQGDVCVNIDHGWFQENGVAEPTSLDQLAEPEYASRLVVENPASSSPGLAFLVATIADQGEDGYEAYWQKLLANGAKVAGSWSDAYYSDFSGSEGNGAYPLVVSYATSPAETEGATGIMTASCTRQVEYAGVLAGAANSDGGKAFVDFMLSDDVQKALPESMYMYPINTSIELPEAWARYATQPDSTLNVAPRDAADKREGWIASWTTIAEK